MGALSMLLAGILLLIAAIHALWGFGVWWPASSETALARTVVGAQGIEAMPGAGACFTVALALTGVALITLVEGGVLPAVILPRFLWTVGAIGAAMVFLGRGLVAYTSFWARLTPEQPFHTLDLWVYSPLCLVIGAGLAILVVPWQRLGFS